VRQMEWLAEEIAARHAPQSTAQPPRQPEPADVGEAAPQLEAPKGQSDGLKELTAMKQRGLQAAETGTKGEDSEAPQPQAAAAAASAVARGATAGTSVAATGAAAAAAAAAAAQSKAEGPVLHRGDRISYVGRLHPTLAASHERLNQLQAAISRVEASHSQRAQQYLPQLMVQRSVLAANSQRVPRQQGTGAPPIGSKGRVVNVAGSKVRRAAGVDLCCRSTWVAACCAVPPRAAATSRAAPGCPRPPANRLPVPLTPALLPPVCLCACWPVQVQVVFDEPFPGGLSSSGFPEKCGFACTPEDLQVGWRWGWIGWGGGRWN
jgi:hypothetical protein